MLERLIALFENMPEAVALHEVVCDADGHATDFRVVDVNPQFERHTGRSRADVVGKPASQAFGSSVALYLEELCAVGLGGPAIHREAYFPTLGRCLGISAVPLGPRAFATIISDITATKGQAEALEQSLLRQRALLDNQPHLAWLKDREGRFLAVNKAFAEACGQPSPEALVGKTDLDIWPRALALTYRADDAEVMQSGRCKTIEEQIACASGTDWFEVYKGPVFATDGSVAGTSGVSRSIAEQKRAQAARLQSERKFEQVFDLAPDPVAVTAATGEILYINRAYCQAIGYSREEVTGRRTVDMGLWEDPEVRARVLEQVQCQGRFDAVEIVLISKNGDKRHMEVSGARIELDGQRALITAARDVTERRLAEQQAKLATETLSQYFNLSLDLLCIADLQGHLLRVNPAWTAVLGVPVSALEHAQYLDMIHPDDLAPTREALGRLGDGQTVIDFPIRTRHVDGFWCWLEWRAVPASHGVFFAMGRDVTSRREREAELRRGDEERRKLEQQVMQAQKLESLGRLAGGLAHDFNNLLTTIQGYTDLARGELTPPSAACAYLDDVERACGRAAELCRQMLAYAGKELLVVQPLSLNEVVRETERLLDALLSKKVVVKHNLFPDLPSVVADAPQIRQVVISLMTNAAEAIEETSGTITLSTGVMDCDHAYLQGAEGDDGEVPGQYVYLEVADTGCGMDGETRGRIFEPFFTTKFTGRGLGLPAVMGIVRAHKGVVRVDSQQGRGTTVRVLLPTQPQLSPSVARVGGA